MPRGQRLRAPFRLTGTCSAGTPSAACSAGVSAASPAPPSPTCRRRDDGRSRPGGWRTVAASASRRAASPARPAGGRLGLGAGLVDRLRLRLGVDGGLGLRRGLLGRGRRGVRGVVGECVGGGRGVLAAGWPRRGPRRARPRRAASSSRSSSGTSSSGSSASGCSSWCRAIAAMSFGRRAPSARCRPSAGRPTPRPRAAAAPAARGAAPRRRFFGSTGASSTTTPRPWQCSQSWLNASSRPVPIRLRVICTRPSEVTSATWWRVRSRPEALDQAAQHEVAVGLEHHVDEVDDDDAADVAQPELADDLLGGLEVVLGDGLLEVAAGAGELAGVDVDDGHRLGAVDDQRAARGQPDLAVQALGDLLVDAVRREDVLVLLRLVALEPVLEVGRDVRRRSPGRCPRRRRPR